MGRVRRWWNWIWHVCRHRRRPRSQVVELPPHLREMMDLVSRWEQREPVLPRLLERRAARFHGTYDRGPFTINLGYPRPDVIERFEGRPKPHAAARRRMLAHPRYLPRPKS